MTTLRLLKLFAASLLSICILTSCVDDPIFDPAHVGEGEALIDADVTFTPLVSALESRAEGGAPGNALKRINNLCIVFYENIGGVGSRYATSFYYEYGEEGLKVESTDAPGDTEYSDPDYTGTNHKAEETTLKASVKNLRVPYGKYFIYAVANVGKGVLYNGDIQNDTGNKENASDLLKNIDELKKYQLQWNISEIRANNQMFGYFSTTNRSKGFDAEEITINRPKTDLHAWIKRAASKVTVAFDGTGLKEGVQIFIKSVTIMDIPETCYLGADNPGTAATEDASQPETTAGELPLIANSRQVITYCPYGVKPDDELASDAYTADWPGLVSKARPINGFDQTIVANSSLTAEKKLEDLHGETINALYFYENLQGKGTAGTPTDKRQQVTDQHKLDGVVSYPDGVDPSNIAWKDAKKYGTYIVVQAYYKSGNTKEGEGPITYRFMLGKDTKLDYNAERNHHYKLTLKFNGWANDVDWHIDYKKDPVSPLRYPHPFFISYLYGQPSMIPVEFDAPEGTVITGVVATITENNWFPKDAEAYGWNGQLNMANIQGSQPGMDLYNSFRRWVSTPELQNKPWNGFLSLTKPVNELVIPIEKDGDNIRTYTQPSMMNQRHYVANELGWRTYNEEECKISTIPLYEAWDQDEIHVSWDNGTYYVKIPIWTRAKNMIKVTGYTGMNPYHSYRREAKVNLKIHIRYPDGTTTILDSDNYTVGGNPVKGDDVQVLQVRRVVNPVGVYRSANSFQPFHVVLKYLASSEAKSFSDLTSVGPWRAYVLRDSEAEKAKNYETGGFVSLTQTTGANTTTADYTFEFNNEVMHRKSIEGIGGSKIDFNINFDGTSSSPRYAIVRIEYNYNSCYHTIYIRQGYAADYINSPDKNGNVEGVKWYTGNSISQNEIAANPLDEGSLFRYGNWNGIKSISNVNGTSFDLKGPLMATPDDFLGNAAGDLSMVDGTTTTWENISSVFPDDGKYFPPSGVGRVATYSDYKTLVTGDNMKTDFGVCYGDGATETASTLETAFRHKGSEPSAKGMRGCFVYNRDTGANIFFPIGSSGFGHRKHRLSKIRNTAPFYYGVLRYSSNPRWGYFNTVTATTYQYGVYNAPLFFDIFRSYGAIYWFGQSVSAPDEDVPGTYAPFPAWDMNYSTFDFHEISASNVGDAKANVSDACFIRCVEN